MKPSRYIPILGGTVLLSLALVIGPAAADHAPPAPPENATCSQFTGHSGGIPSSYDFGVGQEFVDHVLIDSFRVDGGQNGGSPSNGGTWDYVWKCHDDPVVETTTSEPSTTTSSVVDSTTTTIVDTTTTSTQPKTSSTIGTQETTTSGTNSTTTSLGTIPTTTETPTTPPPDPKCKEGAEPDANGVCQPILPNTGLPTGRIALSGLALVLSGILGVAFTNRMRHGLN